MVVWFALAWLLWAVPIVPVFGILRYYIPNARRLLWCPAYHSGKARTVASQSSRSSGARSPDILCLENTLSQDAAVFRTLRICRVLQRPRRLR